MLIEKTRNNNLLVDGLSPRAGLAMFRLSQSLAHIEGRDFVIPEDIQKAFLPIASHRMRSRSTQQNVITILESILSETRIS